MQAWKDLEEVGYHPDSRNLEPQIKVAKARVTCFRSLEPSKRLPQDKRDEAVLAKVKPDDDIWKADVIQYPYDIGKLTVETIDRFLKGELAESDETQFIPVKVGIVDVENAE